MPNRTHRFIVKDNIYDSYTHESLGEYLRFMKYLLKIDLMPLYNCFSGRICNKFTLADDDRYLLDDSHKLYMMPIRPEQKYTIAIDSDSKIEIFCAEYSPNAKAAATLMERKAFPSAAFAHPIVYETLEAEKPEALMLFISVAASNSSALTVLEGDYSG